MIRVFRGVRPTIPASAYVDDCAQVIGDVVIGEESSVWMNAVVRGDVNTIRIGRRTNIQDGTIVHVMREPSHPTMVGDEVTVGHGVVLHGCTVADRCLIGMGAILLNGSSRRGGQRSLPREHCCTEGAVMPPRSLVMGSPGKVRRALTDDEVAFIRDSAANYVAYRLDYLSQGCPQPHPPARGCATFFRRMCGAARIVIGVIADVYQRYGFEPLETPAVENIETLLGKYGEEGDRLIFKILKRGEEGRQTGDADLALRYDLTVPLARVVAEYQGQAAEVLQALPDSARVARRSAAEGALPRVLPVRRGRDRIDVGGRRGRGLRRGLATS